MSLDGGISGHNLAHQRALHIPQQPEQGLDNAGGRGRRFLLPDTCRESLNGNYVLILWAANDPKEYLFPWVTAAGRRQSHSAVEVFGGEGN